MARLFLVVAASLFASTHGFLPATITCIVSPSRVALAPVMAAKPNPVAKIVSAGMGLAKPVFVLEAKLQAAALGWVVGHTIEDAVAEINQAQASNRCVCLCWEHSKPK